MNLCSLHDVHPAKSSLSIRTYNRRMGSRPNLTMSLGCMPKGRCGRNYDRRLAGDPRSIDRQAFGLANDVLHTRASGSAIADLVGYLYLKLFHINICSTNRYPLFSLHKLDVCTGRSYFLCIQMVTECYDAPSLWQHGNHDGEWV